MDVSIADKNSNLESLSRLFANNLTPQYISHSELQGYRALRPGRWVKNIKSVLKSEIGSRMKQPRRTFPTGRNWSGVVQAYEGSRLVGMGLVTISHNSVVPFAV